MDRTLFSRNSDEWETPQDIYDELDAEFHFTLDACATDENHKHERYYTMSQDALKKSWGGKWYSAIHHTPISEHGYGKPITKDRLMIR